MSRLPLLLLLAPLLLAGTVPAPAADHVVAAPSPQLARFLDGHPEASRLLYRVLADCFSRRALRVRYFHSDDPSVARARHTYPDAATVEVSIRDGQQPLDEYICLLFEALNSEGEDRFRDLVQRAAAGTISRADFVRGVMRQEFQAERKCRARLLSLPLGAGEKASSYYYSRCVGLPDDFETSLAYFRKIAPQRDAAGDYGRAYDRLRAAAPPSPP